MAVFDSVSAKADKTIDSARETARRARDTYDEGRRQLPKAGREARQVLDDSFEQVRGQARDAAASAGEQIDTARLYMVERVQERPFTATLAALGAGFVLGLLFAGGRR